ncbi:hypothetical protein JCM8547_008619 [Rhodosporidiobolus lusitaniae]
MTGTSPPSVLIRPDAHRLLPAASSSTRSSFGRLVPRGVYTPVCTFFFPDSQDLDIKTFQKHVKYVAGVGVGIVALGSIGEAVHLTHSERSSLVSAARSALDSNPALAKVPLVVGTGASSTRETIELTKEAAERGADFAMVIAPGYFAGALSKQALKAFFVEVAEASPIPVILYNYPGASAGIDMDSDLIADIAASAPNVVGVKLTCGSVGKLSRLTNLREDFAVLGGFVDFLGPSLFSDTAGGITGTANIAPKSCLALYRSTIAALSSTPSPSALAEAQKLQYAVSRADWALQKAGISGTKFVLEQTRGYGGAPRRPLLPYDGNDGKEEKLLEDMKEIMELEASL